MSEALRAAIEALVIDPPGAALRFTDRLARENGWSAAHAEAVDREYRRFLYLAATGDTAVTPSDAVDQAWHLHLAYTRSYWDDLCGRVLGRALHHGPTAGGDDEAARYRAQYEATLARYAAVFGEAPPPAIWPPMAERFGARFVRVDRARAWIVPRRVASVAALPVAGVAIAAAGGDGPGWGLVLVVLVVIAILYLTRDKKKRGGGDVDVGDECGGDSGCGGCGGD